MCGIPHATRRQVSRGVLLSLLAALALGLLGAENVHMTLADSPGKTGQAEPTLPTAPVRVPVAANSTTPLTPVSSGFTYQGSLKSGGSPANGQYDFQFTLYDALTGGNVVGGPVTTANVTVTGGLFTVTLDFGQPAFQGEARYLEIAVRQTGGGTYTTLTPRQALTTAPYALSLRPGAVISGTGGTNAGVLTAINTGTGRGIYGESNSSSSYGVFGISTDGTGVYGTSTNDNGVTGNSTNGNAVYGWSVNGNGMDGFSVNFEGVRGATDSNYAGVYGTNGSGGGIGPGVRGDGNTGPGVYGISTSGWAGYFEGNVNVTGTCCAAAEGTYRIDDPLDPANKYLNHAAVESQDMLDMINGNATTDAHGDAIVTLPSYFQATNRDFRYQLTVIGQFAQAIVSSEMRDNNFSIKTDKPNVKVSWQVTGVRNDPYAQQHPLTAEQAKPANEKGYYLHPELYGQPNSKSVDPEVRNPPKALAQPVQPESAPPGGK